MSIRQIVYVSSGVCEYAPDEVKKIADAGCRNNAENGITGILLYYNGNFMQLLEGAPNVVDETFERISSDDRHSGILKLQDAIVGERSFPDYNMGFCSIARDAASNVSDLFEALPTGWDVKPDAELGKNISALFRTFFAINSGFSPNQVPVT
jgi:hypothetical protein